MDGSSSIPADSLPDFSDLPDVVWVQVLKYLELKDRVQASRTCHALNHVFHHPSLWYSAEIKLLGSIARYSESSILMPSWYKIYVNKFGSYFQDLTLSITHFFSELPKECLEVLDALSANCRLEKLTLTVGSVVVKGASDVPAKSAHLAVLANIVSRAFRMKKFILKSWPLHRNVVHTVNILKVLCENDKLNELEMLSLYWKSASETTWATLNANLPSPEDVYHTVCHFTRLTTLCLQSTMLDDRVISELAGALHTPLRRLGILLTFSRTEPLGSIPDVKTRSWTTLKEHCPNLKVDVTVVTRVPYFDLHGFLKPEIPLEAISFMKYSQCTKEDYRALCDKYCHCLRKFNDYSDGTDCDSNIILLVNSCQKLDDFLYMGRIHADTVCHLAGLRGKNWYRFQLNYDNIQTYDQDVVYDENIVIQSTDDGNFVFHQPPWVQLSDEVHQNRLKKMIINVGKKIGKLWRPLNSKYMNDIWEENQANIGIVPASAVR